MIPFNVEAELQEIRRLQKTKKYKSLAKKVSKIPCIGPSVAEVFAMMNGERRWSKKCGEIVAH